MNYINTFNNFLYLREIARIQIKIWINIITSHFCLYEFLISQTYPVILVYKLSKMIDHRKKKIEV